MKKNNDDNLRSAFDLYGKALEKTANSTDFSDNLPEYTTEITNRANPTTKRPLSKKKILSIVVSACLVLCITLGVIFSNMAGQIPLKNTVYASAFPNGIGYFDNDAERELYQNNPVDESFVDGITQFSLATASRLLTSTTANGNYSPISLYYALSLLSSGANGETKTQLQALLNTAGLSDEYIATQLGNLYRLSFVDNVFGQTKIANSLWLSDKAKIKDSFVDNLTEHYYVSMYTVDFVSKEASRLMSNWIKSNTNGTLSPDISTDSDTMLAIINSIYFRDEWTERFNSGKTKKGDFNLYDGTTVTVDYMNKTFGSHRYSYSDYFARSDLSTKNGSSVSFVLPLGDKTAYDIISDEKLLNEALFGGEQKYGEVIWQLPKFNFDSGYDLKNTLVDLGVTEAFNNSADFGKITDELLFISSATQQTHIAIDEKGVEASAYVMLLGAGAAMPEGVCEMTLDKPFIYAITNPKGAVLFVGVCNNPTLTK